MNINPEYRREGLANRFEATWRSGLNAQGFAIYEGCWRAPGDRDWRIARNAADEPFTEAGAAERAAYLAMTAHINRLISHAVPGIIDVRWDSAFSSGIYRVDRPDWHGGQVVELGELLRPATGDVDTDSPLDIALINLARALDFHDRVKASTQDEQIAVGVDHIDGLMDATRKLAAFAGVKTFGGARG